MRTNFPKVVLETRDSLDEAGIATELRREHDAPSEAILAVADELGVDLIVMSGRKRSGVGKVIFGSVTQGVLLNADVPVTIVMT